MTIEIEKKKKFKTGLTSTIKPRFELIPQIGLKRVAARFELGLIKHGDAAWNNLKSDDTLDDREWLIERASHAIGHLYNVIDKLTNKIPLGGDDDAAAVAWAGLVLSTAMEKLESKTSQETS